VSAIQLRDDLWLIVTGDELTLAKDQYGTNVIGHVVRKNPSKWRIDGRDDEFESAKSAANELVKEATGRPL
jgi:hypothetical protein